MRKRLKLIRVHYLQFWHKVEIVEKIKIARSKDKEVGIVVEEIKKVGVKVLMGDE